MDNKLSAEYGESSITKRQKFFINLEDDSEGREKESDGKGEVELVEIDGEVVLETKGVVKEIMIAKLLEDQLGVENGEAEYKKQVEHQNPEEPLEFVFEKEDTMPFKVVSGVNLRFVDMEDNALNFGTVERMIESLGGKKLG